MADIPPLPPGFKLDTAASIPPLPDGFTLDGEPPAQPKATVLERTAAGAAGVNSGVARVVGLPVDTIASVRDLMKAGVGSAVGAFRETDETLQQQPKSTRMFDVDIDGNLVPSRNLPVPQIPEWAKIGDRAQDFGSGEYIRAQINKLPGRPADNPRPDDTASRYLFAGGESLAPAVAGARVAPTPLNVANPTTNLAANVTANVAGSQASQFAAERGYGPAGQLLAGTVAGGASLLARPVGAELTKRAFRGGEVGRERTAQNIQDFENAGAQASAGQATQSRRVQATESLLSKTPGASGRMAAKAEQQAGNLGANIEKLASQLAPKASGEQAGRAITTGVTGETGFIAQFKNQSKKNYDTLDNFVKKDAPFALPKTAQALDELTRPISGAEETSKFFVNSTIRSIKEAMDADLAAGNSTIPYEAVKKIRSIVGENLADAPFAGDVPRSQWKKLYSALSEDIEKNASGAGQKAQDALARANKYHAAGMKRIDVISAVIDKNGGPEAVFRAATSGAKEGATTLRSIMQSLPPDAQKMLSASVLRRLGRATAGKQDDLGETFSTETFLTNWNTLSPQAKGVLFDRYGAGFRSDMDNIASVAANLRSGSRVFQNPSGTGQTVAQATTAGMFALSVLRGDVASAGAIAGGVTAANLTARLMTNPRFVKWLAKSTQAPPKALPALIAQLEQGTEDEKEFAAMLRRQSTLNLRTQREQPTQRSPQ